MHYMENRESNNIKELFENNFALFVNADDGLKIIEILKKADKTRLDYIRRIKNGN